MERGIPVTVVFADVEDQVAWEPMYAWLNKLAKSYSNSMGFVYVGYIKQPSRIAYLNSNKLRSRCLITLSFQQKGFLP